MFSGVGYDVQDLVKIIFMGMIFVLSVGGISYFLKEYMWFEDMVNGVNVFLYILLVLDKKDL